MPSLLEISFFAVLPAIAIYALCGARWRRSSVKLPPGPKPLPIVGNAFDLPKLHAWLTYTEWKKTYGDVVHVCAFGQPIIFLNSFKAASDLLHRRAAYADRIGHHMIGELMGWNRYIPGLRYGDTWREHRRLISGQMGKTVTGRFWPIQQADARNLLKNLARSPEDFLKHVRLMAGKVIMNTTYGLRSGKLQDDYIELAHEAISHLSAAAAPGAYLVDVLPILRYVPSWFPGAQFKRDAAVWRQMSTDMAVLPYEYTKGEVAAGTAHSSFVQTCLEGEQLSPTDEENITFASGTLFLAGADTTVAAISSFFLAMALHPDVQLKAQQELDRVVGQHSLPTFENRENLPYVNALLKELTRWAPVFPMGVPHGLFEDDIYEDMLIPAGSLVMANVWAISQDPEMYPDPRRFSPERFLKTEKDAEVALDPYSYAFGFGRRTCAGMWYADSAVWIAIVSVLHSFTISKALGENGNVIVPADAFVSGLMAHPEPFKCNITPRLNAAVARVLADPDEL